MAAGGFADGALNVRLENIDSAQIANGMSGGWRKTFTLSGAADAILSLRYNLTQDANYENDEYSEALVALDGVHLQGGGNDYLAKLTGDGNEGLPPTTGWQLAELNLGNLAAGNHILTVGGYNNKKTSLEEATDILVDDVILVTTTGRQPLNSPPEAHIESMSPSAGVTPLTVTFAGHGHDTAGPLSHQWDFGDQSENAIFADVALDANTTVQHTYDTAGTFTATLQVTDPQGASHSNSVLVTVTTLTLDEPDLILDRPERFRIIGSGFVPNEDYTFRLLHPSTKTVRFSTVIRCQDPTAIEVDLTSQISALSAGFYTLELERIGGGSKVSIQDFLITKLGDIWSSQATDTSARKKDGVVDAFDVSRMLTKWDSTNLEDLAEADINPGLSGISAGKVDIFDANKLMANWTPS